MANSHDYEFSRTRYSGRSDVRLGTSAATIADTDALSAVSDLGSYRLTGGEWLNDSLYADSTDTAALESPVDDQLLVAHSRPERCEGN